MCGLGRFGSNTSAFTVGIDQVASLAIHLAQVLAHKSSRGDGNVLQSAERIASAMEQIRWQFLSREN